MENGVVVVLASVASVIALSAFFMVLGGLFQSLVTRSKNASGGMPGQSFLIGLVNALFFSVVALGFNALGDATGFEVLRLPALLLVVVFAILIAYGLSGMAWLIGERLFPERRWAVQLLLGSLSMILASLTPYLGWFLLFPYLCFRGLGGALLGITRGRRSELAGLAEDMES